MPSVWNRLAGLFPGFGRETAPAQAERPVTASPPTAPQSAAPRRTAAEKVPHQHGGLSKITFLPYLDSATKDSVEIRAAMRKMLRSPWVKAAWTSQVFEVARQEYQFQADPDDPAAPGHALFLRHCVDRMPMGLAGLVLSVTLPLGPDGVSVAEKVEEIETRGRWAGKIVPKAVKSKDLETLQLLGDEFRNLTTVRSLRAKPGGATEWDAREFLIAQYLPVFCDPYGTAAFRASYAAYWMLDTVQKLRAIHHEKRTSGTLVGTYTDDDQLSTLESALAALKSTTWAAVPEGVKIECLPLTTAADTDYRAFEQDKQTEIVAGIAGATLHILQGNVTDARGDTQVQQETSELGPWYLTRIVEEVVNRQWVPDYLDRNFPAVQSYPRLTLGAVTEEERQKKLATLKAALDAGFDNLDKAYYARELSLQTTDDPAKALKAIPAPGLPPPGGGFGGPARPFAEGGAARRAETFPRQVLAAFAEPPPGSAPVHDQTALPGADGRRAVELLRRATAEGTAALHRVAEQAVRRLLADPDWRSATTLFDDAELKAVADALGATVATADLLGRSRVVGLAERAGAKAKEFAEGGRKFSYAGVNLTGPAAERILAMAAAIEDADLGDDGREDRPHVTARYGLHTTDPDDVRRAVAGTGPVTLTLRGVSAFRGGESDKPYDVLIVPVDSPDLHRLHESLGGLDHTDTWKEYKPHATIGYVKAGLADKYLERFAGQAEPLTATADRIEFSDPDKNRAVIPLAGPGPMVRTFADPPDPFLPFADPPPALAPRAAVDYFRRLVPTLGIDPERFGPLLDRHAFTLAHATDQTLLEKVKQGLGLVLEGRAADAGAAAGIQGPPPTGPEVVAKLLADAGVHPRNGQYAEMVFRTNMLESYRSGAEAQAFSMPEEFPVWQYLGIRDGRQGDDHEPHFDNYYPTGVPFHRVRGPRVFNCRCTPNPVHASAWSELQARGVQVSQDY